MPWRQGFEIALAAFNAFLEQLHHSLQRYLLPTARSENVGIDELNQKHSHTWMQGDEERIQLKWDV